MPWPVALEHRVPEPGAFTLVELMVVIAVIAIGVGVLGTALRGDNPGAATQSAQSTLASMLAAARSQAVLKHANAAVVVFAEAGDARHYLRWIAIAGQESGDWVRTGDYVSLPKNVVVFPPITVTGPRSSALAPFTLEGKQHYALGYTALGVPDFAMFGQPSANHQIAMASLPRDETAVPDFAEAVAVRGILLSDYGAISFINDATELTP